MKIAMLLMVSLAMVNFVLGATEVLRPIADTLVVNPSETNPWENAALHNYGGSGSRSIASKDAYSVLEDGSTQSAKGEMSGVFKFDFSGLDSQNVSAMSLQLNITCGNQSAGDLFNYRGTAGYFDIVWVSENSWTQGYGAPHDDNPASDGSLTYSSLSEMLLNSEVSTLSRCYYDAAVEYPGTAFYDFEIDLGLNGDFLDSVLAGETITLMLNASENSNVAFNYTAYIQNYETKLPKYREEGASLTVSVPEPTSALFLIFGLGLCNRQRKNSQTIRSLSGND